CQAVTPRRQRQTPRLVRSTGQGPVRLHRWTPVCDNPNMSRLFPDYLRISADRLAERHSVSIRIVADVTALAQTMARDMADVIRTAAQAGRPSTLIIPVGPVDQF